MSKKINITSTVAEKGIDLAKDFLGKLITPPLEETGLLIKDQIASWRFRNQIKILSKAKKHCEKQNISPKQVSFKLICPLLEYASLEEDEKLQNKWAILISNLVDSEQNIENHVFPYILSQISLNEYESLESTLKSHNKRIKKLKKELHEFEDSFQKKKSSIMEEIENSEGDAFKKMKLKNKLWELEWSEKKIRNKIAEQEVLKESNLKNYELSNLVRLGLIKNVVKHIAYSEPIEIPNREEMDYYSHNSRVELEIEVDPEYEYHELTQLGELFISACTIKK